MWRGYDPTPDGRGSAVCDFTAYNNQLTDQQWITLQAKERAFRETLDTKRLHEKNQFTCWSGLAKWFKPISLLNGVYFKNGTFSVEIHGKETPQASTFKIHVHSFKKAPTG